MKNETTKYNTIINANLPITWHGSNGETNYWGIKRSRAIFGHGFIRDERDDCLDYVGDRELTGWELVNAIDIVRAIAPSPQLIDCIEAFSDCYIVKQDGLFALCRRDYDADGVEQVRYAPEYGDCHPFSHILLGFLIGGRNLELIQC